MILLDDPSITEIESTPDKIVLPKKLEGPDQSLQSEELVYRLTEYWHKCGEKTIADPTDEEQAQFDADKDEIKWAFWVDGGQMTDRKKDFIKISNREPSEESLDDFTTLSEPGDKSKFIERLNEDGYIEAQVETTFENGIKINQLRIKFSKWLDERTVYVEAYRRKPDHNSAQPYVVATKLISAPEIIEAYWINEVGERITLTGFETNISLYVNALGLKGTVLDFQLFDQDRLMNPDDPLPWSAGASFEVAGRHSFIPYEVGKADAQMYVDARADDVTRDLEVFVKIERQTPYSALINDPNFKYGEILFADNQSLRPYFGKPAQNRVGGQSFYDFHPAESLYPGEKVMLMAQCYNVEDDTEITFTVTEETPLLFGANAKVPLVEGATEKTTFKAKVKAGVASVEVEIQKKGSPKFKQWNDLLDDESEAGKAIALRLTAQLDAISYESTIASKLKASVIRYILHSNGIIKYKRKYAEQARYIFKEENQTLHYLTKVDFNNVKHHKRSTIYRKEFSQLTNLKEVKPYSNGQVKYKIKEVVSSENRFYIDVDCLACLLAAMIEVQIEDLVSTGFSLSNGTTGIKSVSHYNGMVGDLRYLNVNKTGERTHLSKSKDPKAEPPSWKHNEAFDYDRQVLFNEALYKYGFSKYKLKMLSEKFIRKINNENMEKLLPHTNPHRKPEVNSYHYDHLHIAGLDLSFFELRE